MKHPSQTFHQWLHEPTFDALYPLRYLDEAIDLWIHEEPTVKPTNMDCQERFWLLCPGSLVKNGALRKLLSQDLLVRQLAPNGDGTVT